MRRRVSLTQDDGLASDAATVSLVLRDGRMVTINIEHCRGSQARPMSDVDFPTSFSRRLRSAIEPIAAKRCLQRLGGSAKRLRRALLFDAGLTGSDRRAHESRLVVAVPRSQDGQRADG